MSDTRQKTEFQNHVSILCTKASQKLHALVRVSEYMEKSKLELTMTSVVMSHFSYCPLFWMFHDRALRITNKDSTVNFEGLLIKGSSVSVHQRNLQLLFNEIYKTINNLNPSFIAEVFVTNVLPYNLPGNTNFVLPNAGTNLCGIETVGFVG